MNVSDLQRMLSAENLYRGYVDGDYGPNTQQGVMTVLQRNDRMLPKGWERWSWKRRGIAAAQVMLSDKGFETGAVDGYFGPQTKYALWEWEHALLHANRPEPWRPEDNIQQTDEGGDSRRGWPHQSSLEKFYGKAGGPQCTAGKVKMPFPMVIAWNTRQKIDTFSCHEKVADSAQKVYEKIASAYSPEDIARLGFNQFGGCYNYRKMRGGSSLSTHAYGIAIDHDPVHNQLRWNHERAKLARDDCKEFWRCWESEGWLSLGRHSDFDWMHVQAAIL